MRSYKYDVIGLLDAAKVGDAHIGGERMNTRVANLVSRPQNRIDAGIAGQMDASRYYAFFQQSIDIRLGRNEMKGGQTRDHLAHRFFRERGREIVGPESRFDVANRNVFKKSGETGCECRNRIALDKHQIGTLSNQHGAQTGENTGGQAVQVLIVMHYRKIVIGANAEEIQRLVEQFAMLAGNADSHIEVRGPSRSPDDRRHLNCFRPRAKDKKDLHK